MVTGGLFLVKMLLKIPVVIVAASNFPSLVLLSILLRAARLRSSILNARIGVQIGI